MGALLRPLAFVNALLLPSAVRAALLAVPDDVVSARGTAVLLYLAGPAAVVVLAVAEVWALVATPVPAAPGWGVLGRCAAAAAA